MKNMKRMAALLLIVVLCVGILALPAMAVGGPSFAILGEMGNYEDSVVHKSIKTYTKNSNTGKLEAFGEIEEYNIVADDSDISIVNSSATVNIIVLLNGYTKENGKYIASESYVLTADGSFVKLADLDVDLYDVVAVEGIDALTFYARDMRIAGGDGLYKLQYLQLDTVNSNNSGVYSVAYMIDNEKAAEIMARGKNPDDPGNPFTDVPKDAYYHDAVLWALEKSITTGLTETTFGPEETCTRGQVATFLWRAKGCPEPETTENPFTDVSESDYYYKPILWAYENGITTGTTETTFSPNGTCTSAHVITFLWRANGEPEAKTEGTEYYAKAVAWATRNKLLDGTDMAFAPENLSPRADIVTYLYRDAK